MVGYAPRESFLGELDEAQADDLMSRGERVHFDGGDVLIAEGDVEGLVYVVLAGGVDISRTGQDGGEMALATRGIGELLGELGALDARPRSATVTANQSTDALQLRASELLAFLADHPRIALRVIQELARRLRAAEDLAAGFERHDLNAVMSARRTAP